MVDVRGDVLRPPHGTTPAAVKANKIQKLSSFKYTRYWTILIKVNKESLFKMSTYQVTRGHSQKIYKQRYRLKIRGHFFSNRIVHSWNNLPSEVVNAPSLNSFKSRLNKCWIGHPHKFDPWCYTPGDRTRFRPHPHKFDPWCYTPGDRTRFRPNYQNASLEVSGPRRTPTT